MERYDETKLRKMIEKEVDESADYWASGGADTAADVKSNYAWDFVIQMDNIGDYLLDLPAEDQGKAKLLLKEYGNKRAAEFTKLYLNDKKASLNKNLINKGNKVKSNWRQALGSEYKDSFKRYKTENGDELNNRAEFSGDKQVTKTGDPAQVELKAWKRDNATFKRYFDKEQKDDYTSLVTVPEGREEHVEASLRGKWSRKISRLFKKTAIEKEYPTKSEGAVPEDTAGSGVKDTGERFFEMKDEGEKNKVASLGKRAGPEHAIPQQEFDWIDKNIDGLKGQYLQSHSKFDEFDFWKWAQAQYKSKEASLRKNAVGKPPKETRTFIDAGPGAYTFNFIITGGEMGSGKKEGSTSVGASSLQDAVTKFRNAYPLITDENEGVEGSGKHFDKMGYCDIEVRFGGKLVDGVEVNSMDYKFGVEGGGGLKNFDFMGDPDYEEETLGSLNKKTYEQIEDKDKLVEKLYKEIKSEVGDDKLPSTYEILERANDEDRFGYFTKTELNEIARMVYRKLKGKEASHKTNWRKVFAIGEPDINLKRKPDGTMELNVTHPTPEPESVEQNAIAQNDNQQGNQAATQQPSAVTQPPLTEQNNQPAVATASTAVKEWIIRKKGNLLLLGRECKDRAGIFLIRLPEDLTKRASALQNKLDYAFDKSILEKNGHDWRELISESVWVSRWEQALKDEK